MLQYYYVTCVTTTVAECSCKCGSSIIQGTAPIGRCELHAGEAPSSDTTFIRDKESGKALSNKGRVKRECKLYKKETTYKSKRAVRNSASSAKVMHIQTYEMQTK